MSYPLPHTSCTTQWCKQFNSPLYGAGPHSTRKKIALEAVYELVKLGVTFVKGHDWRPKDWEKLNRDEKMKLKVTRALEVLTKDEKKVLEDASHTVLRDYKEVPLSLGTKTGPRDLKQSKPSPHEKLVIEYAQTVIYKIGIKSSKMRDIYGELELLERSELIQEIFFYLGIGDPIGVFDGANFLWYLNAMNDPHASEEDQDRFFLMASASLIGVAIPWIAESVIKVIVKVVITAAKVFSRYVRGVGLLTGRLAHFAYLLVKHLRPEEVAAIISVYKILLKKMKNKLPEKFVERMETLVGYLKRRPHKGKFEWGPLPSGPEMAKVGVVLGAYGTKTLINTLGITYGIYAFMAHTKCGKSLMHDLAEAGVGKSAELFIDLVEKEKGKVDPAALKDMAEVIRIRKETLESELEKTSELGEKATWLEGKIKALAFAQQLMLSASARRVGDLQFDKYGRDVGSSACSVSELDKDLNKALNAIRGKLTPKELNALKRDNTAMYKALVPEHLDTLIPRDTPSRFKVGTIVVYKDKEAPGQEGEYVIFKTKSSTDTIVVVRKEEWVQVDGKVGHPTDDAETRTVSYMQIIPLSSVKEEPIITGSKIKKLNEEFEKIFLNMPT